MTKLLEVLGPTERENQPGAEKVAGLFSYISHKVLTTVNYSQIEKMSTKLY